MTAGLAERLDRLQRQLLQGQGRAATLRQQKEELSRQRAELSDQSQLYRQVEGVLRHLGLAARKQVCAHLEAVVTKALQYVYGPEFAFEIEHTERRGRPTVEFYVISNGLRNRPQDARGGGVVDTVSLALRIAVLTLFRRPYLNGPLVLDEPGKHLDAQGALRLGEFLAFVSRAFRRQIIVITHHEAVAAYADRTYQVLYVDGASRVLADKEVSPCTLL